MLLLEPFQYQFFFRGFIAACIAGGLCGLVSVYIVLRKMSYIGHGLSHAIFGGAVVTYILNLNFYIGATIWAIFSAIIISLLSLRRRVAQDTAIGIVTTASFALGIAIISTAPRFTRNLEAALFGNILGITTSDLLGLMLVFCLTLTVLFLFHRQLIFVSFDPEVAWVYGIKVWVYETLLSLILALTIVVSLRIMGVTLIAALLVLPAATARLIIHDINRLLIFSPIVGVTTAISGMYLSFFLKISSGATIVLVATVLFFLMYTLSNQKRLMPPIH